MARALDIPHGHDAPSVRPEIMLRWGAVDNVAQRPGRVINKRDAILKASNKFTSLVHMSQHGVRVPPSYAAGHYVELPAFGRKRHHTGGTDIMFCIQQSDVERAVAQGADYFVKYIPTRREYRIHVAFGEAIRVNEKVLSEVATNTTPWIRNWHNGYRFLRPRTRLADSEKQMAIDAVNSLDLDFGAVDLVIGDDQRPYVLEVNTAPGLVDTDSGEGIGIDAYLEVFRPIFSATQEG